MCVQAHMIKKVTAFTFHYKTSIARINMSVAFASSFHTVFSGEAIMFIIIIIIVMLHD